MNEVFKALNAALRKLPWWEKPVIVFFYPVLWVGLWLALQATDKKKGNNE